MIRPIFTNTRRSLYRLLMLQALVTIVSSVAFWLGRSPAAGQSALLGGIICILGNGYVGYKLFAQSGARQARQIIKVFYRAETIKYLLLIILFIIAIRFLRVQGLPFLLSFFICQMVFWIAPLFFNNSNKTS